MDITLNNIRWHMKPDDVASNLQKSLWRAMLGYLGPNFDHGSSIAPDRLIESVKTAKYAEPYVEISYVLGLLELNKLLVEFAIYAVELVMEPYDGALANKLAWGALINAKQWLKVPDKELEREADRIEMLIRKVDLNKIAKHKSISAAQTVSFIIADGGVLAGSVVPGVISYVMESCEVGKRDALEDMLKKELSYLIEHHSSNI